MFKHSTTPTNNIYFDMDDTLTRTTDYFVNRTKEILAERNDTQGVEEFTRLAESGTFRHLYGEKYVSINKAIVDDRQYILNVNPTALFNYFFLVPGNQPDGVNFNILTHRGVDKRSIQFTKSWFDKFTLAAQVGKIHSICHNKNPSKLEYLNSLHPDGDFILIDDNPLFFVDREHPFSDKIRIFDKHSSYKAYAKMKTVEFNNGVFLI